ncbi:gluconokinase [Yinghuangia seranimata]|uniref:gluconokinase n=1 Tax=Yinghuangia seranimata TaxID=408067 RepID=UPI00248C75A1|nr:gluconokinase [Yinghuangia seranimata]MDI2125054.1 gluconokinase [Yinghuangia seranimata]
MPSSAGGPPVVIVMGVSGAGKTHVASRLAERLGLPYLDADDLHPPENRAKMASGHRLDESDRRPWLAAVTERIRSLTAGHRGGVIACSALKRGYRDQFRTAGAGVWFVQLDLDRATAAGRIAHRLGHFMPPQLLDSQFEDLEPLQDDEPGAVVDASGTMPDTVEAAIRSLPEQAR